MKSIIIIIILLNSLLGFSQDSIDQNLPKIEFRNPIFDFGDIQYNSPGNHNFVFRNIGKGPLIIKSVKSS